MRHDARPIGEANPHGGTPAADHDLPADACEPVAHDCQSHVVSEAATEPARRSDADVDPVRPTGDSRLTTKI